MTTAMTTVDTTDIQQIATGFLMRAEQVRSVIAKTMQDAPFAASAAMIAGQFAIEAAMTETDKAFIKKCVERKKILVEGTSGTVPDTAICAVVAEAAAKQLLLGAGHYSVWANGTLYVKEAGYRHLLKIRGGVSEVDISPGLPRWEVLKDKSMWVIPGKASAKVDGKLVSVECTIGINGNATDIIANIEAKAFRSLAKRLWLKVSSIELEDGDTDDTLLSQDNQQPAAITEQPVVDAAAEKLRVDGIMSRQQFDRCRKMIANTPEHLEFFNGSITDLEACKTLEQLDMTRKAMTETRKGLKLSQAVTDELKRFIEVREAELRAGGAVA
jgi:hypothetical protein